MYVCNLIAFLCCVMFPVGLTEPRRMRNRRNGCVHGTYQHEGITCCLCPTGRRVSRDCTNTNGTVCELCEPNLTYLDHPNNDHKCQPCKICDPNANMKIKNKCSPYSNTVCECQKDHYCDQGDQCRICRACDRCDEVKTECTETNNTVCKVVKNTTMSNGAIAATVLVPILIICLMGFCYFWKRKKDKKIIDTVPDEVEEPLKELDLNPYLSEIADHLSWKVMKRVALHSGMTRAAIDNHEYNHPKDAREQTYEFLQDWCQKKGLYEAYPSLINTLRAIKERKTADEIKKIVEKGQAEAQP